MAEVEREMIDLDVWPVDRIRDEVAFCTSAAGRLRREDREVAFALEIERLHSIIRRVEERTRGRVFAKDREVLEICAEAWKHD